MVISYKWLKTLLNFDLTPAELAQRLTMIGHAVEEMEDLGRDFQRVVVGRALAVRPHPNADKLKLVEVDYGGGSSLEVVCGAPNVKAGGHYPLALEGASLAGGLKIGKTRIRGVESCGMLCSERELGLSAEASGLLELESSNAPGTPLAAVLGRDDWRLVLELTANRGDMWCHLGVARELQPFAGRRLELPAAEPAETGPPVAELTSVTLEDPEGCPRYMARVIEEVKVGPSPQWLVQRLEAIGQRSINNVVDVTNFVLFELGQPLHAFDLDKLDQRRIVVRKARPEESILTLDEIIRRLDPRMTVIADASKPVAVAGVMGDKLSEVDENTTRILLECAYFDPATNRRTRTALGLFTEASRRFERGVDFGRMPYAVDRAARLISEVSSGRVARGVIDVYPRPIRNREIDLRAARIKRVLGVDLEESEIRRWLEGVDFAVHKTGEGLFRVGVPSCRHLDVRLEEDLIEELARLRGYEKIPVPGRLEVTPEAAGRERFYRESDLRRCLSGMGLQEVLTSAFSGSELVDLVYGAGSFDPLRLESPLSAEEDILRPALLTTLLPCLKRNLNQRHKDLRLFELGAVFPRRPGAAGAAERKHLGVALTGARLPVHWSGAAPDVDFFALKGVLEALFSRLKLPEPELTPEAVSAMHPGVSAAIGLAGEKIGYAGQLNPALARKLDLPENIFVFELLLEPLLSSVAVASYRERSPFPGVRRDLSILVAESLPCAELLLQVRQGSAMVVEVTLFDLYEGENIPAGKRSLALSILFQSRERTLRDADVDKEFNRLFQALVKKFGVQPR